MLIRTVMHASIPWLLGGLLMVWVGVADGRELAVDPETMVEVEIASVAIAVPIGTPVVLLREPGAEEVIPILIGSAEAEAIQRGLRDQQPRRPMTHELLDNVLDGVDVSLERVYVDAIEDDAFLGMLELRKAGQDETIRIDSRPSDAIALSLRTGATIHVAPQVLEAARRIDYQGMDDQVVSALGITVTPVTDDLRDAFELPDREGVLVSDVAGPAEDAGMEPGALLFEVNGQTPEQPMRYLELVRKTPSDAEVRLRYWQEGEIEELALPADIPSPGPSEPEPEEPGLRL
ncbi:bifunctional nuclease domain-containing protein [Aidingimonas halophila]|nr:bifunctional nuclease domain-containing protein [Aidingimonas halophila]GHC23243.1 hypothetical protein GCM10008094_12460 [Aidingimonas halophila]